MKIALCGSAPSSAPLAPYRDASYEDWSNRTQQFPTPPFACEDWEIWGCSPGLWAQAERATRWFETHRWEPGKPWFSPEYVSFLRRFRGKVMTGGVVPEIQNHEVYPIERVEAEFSAYFLHSSLSLMSAMAILQIEDRRKARAAAHKTWALAKNMGGKDIGAGAALATILEEKDKDDVIGYWGVDMSAIEEYSDQRSGCHFFILEAMRRGISVYVPPESCLLRPKPVYGIAEWDHSYIKATQRARELNAKKAHAEQAVQEGMKSANFMAGAIENHGYWINTWTSPYGIPAGLVINHEPGTGLGGGITLPRPFSPPPDNVIDAPADMPSAESLASAGIILDADVAVKKDRAAAFSSIGISPDADFIPTKPTPKRLRPGIKKTTKRRK